MDGTISWLIVAVVAGALWLIVLCYGQHLRSVRRPSGAATRQRFLKPRTPDDCPACRRHSALPPSTPTPPPPPRPWPELKSRRGAPRRIPTAGFACPNYACPYYAITDADIHALVGDGAYGQRERMQTFRCQACKATFSARRDTPLYRLKTPSTWVAEVLTAMAEGLSVAAVVHVFGHTDFSHYTGVGQARV